MKYPILKGLGFGLTSGIITTLGLIIGLHSGTHSRVVVIGGVMIIAIADALSDAFGIHIAEESGNKDAAHIWTATIATFISKFVFALTFLVPILLFPLSTAIMVSIGWGLLLIALFSYYIARQQKQSVWKTIAEHVFIAIVVIVITHFVGDWISTFS